MRVVMIGADCFLGRHTQVRLRALTGHEVVPVDATNWDSLRNLVHGADAVIHFAGPNRASERGGEDDDAQIAREVADALSRAPGSRAIVYAHMRSGLDTDVAGRVEAASILGGAAVSMGSAFVEIVLPTLFGEHYRPELDSFVDQFAWAVVGGQRPDIQDRPVDLMHVQDAAQALIDEVSGDGRRVVHPTGTATSVAGVLDILTAQYDVYRRGDIPALPSRLHVNLFNTLRAAMFPCHYPIPLVSHTDHRGSLVETVRAHGSEGQTFISTTAPGITRGQHFHLRKVERFVVVGGQARISLRRVLTDETVVFDVDGSAPTIVDMPTSWAHKITNTGDDQLTTVFWTNELFNPSDTDTYFENV